MNARSVLAHVPPLRAPRLRAITAGIGDALTAVSRPRTALLAAERMSAVTQVLSSVEYLFSRRDQRPGGLGDWTYGRSAMAARFPKLMPFLDRVSEEKIDNVVHVLRIGAGLSLFLPSHVTAHRAPANAFLAASALVLHPKNHYGSDGSDQLAFLVQTSAALGRVGRGSPRAAEAAVWFLAMQAALSYSVSGLVKIVSRTWRTGEALPGILRTRTYGDEGLYRFLTAHPRLSRLAAHTVLVLETAFPLVFVLPTRAAYGVVGAMAAFHLANARYMGLARFVWAFMATYPAILSLVQGRAARSLTGGAHRSPARLPVIVASVTGILAVVGIGSALVRRAGIERADGPEARRHRTRSRNVLSYRLRRAPGAQPLPLVVFESGHQSSATYWHWYGEELAGRVDTLFYSRAGYGASSYFSRDSYSLQESVDDLVDLVDAVAADRDVVLVGHSLGGYLVTRAAERLGSRVTGVVLLDPTHPGEVAVSAVQAEGARMLDMSMRLVAPSLRLGLGVMLDVPPWVSLYPDEVAARLRAELRDHALWSTAKREWTSLYQVFRAPVGTLPTTSARVDVVAADRTLREHPHQRALDEEFVGAGDDGRFTVVDDTDHLGLLADRAVVARIAAVVLQHTTPRVPVDAEGAR
ncbi:alpha/beta fold hydrolase [Curtobacterium sp. YC1]|uniref:alpha/beta fold hydrolase n=1 Tax=Curtobacterium sp. YC1 TaxID=2795488 RepID=UPI0018E500EF|nr:alpha/beta fold hydrolase [Curtobacterium sp. YC1]QQD76265.1 alpha/beta fold hydrolase [Curtobacterium sp. YC1]